MTYEFDGEKYEKASSFQKELGSSLISELDLTGSERVLDLGCGDGALTSRLAELVPRGFVLGIDASRGMIDTAVKHTGDNLRFDKMDITSIDFKEEFDLVFSNAALHWIKDHGTLLSKVFDSLKPGGVARFNFAAEGNCPNFLKIIRELMAGEEFHEHLKDFNWPWYMPGISEYRELAERLPFKEIHVWGGQVDKNFPDEDALAGWIDQPSIVPFIEHIADKKAGLQFRNTVVERMTEATRRQDGTCLEIYRRVNFVGRK
jgi:trans-aconitate 2-methyltransferase